MLYILASGAGALLAWASTADELPSPPVESVTRALPQWDAPPPSPYVWTPSALDWTIPATLVPTLSRLAFRSRYTVAEQIVLKRAETEFPDPDARATLIISRESLSDANDVDVTDPRTIAAVQFQVTLGLLTASRAAEILAPSVLDGP